MKLKNILYATAATLALAACSNDGNEAETAPQALQLQANIATETRVSNGAFVKDDAIGVYAVSTAAGGLTSGSNVKYVATDGSGNFSSSTPIYYKDKNAVNVAAYYPYAETLTNGAMSVTRAEQVDYLFAKAENVAYNTAKLSLTFDHVTAQFTLIVKAGTGVPSLADLTTVTLKGLNSAGSFNTQTGVLTSSTPADYALAAADFTATASAETTTTTTTTTPATSEYATLLLFPTSGQTDIAVDVVYGGVTYSGTLTSANGLLAGKSYTYTLTINRTGLTVDSASITPWGSGATGSSDATIQPETTQSDSSTDNTNQDNNNANNG
jgi:hypothetical protein